MNREALASRLRDTPLHADEAYKAAKHALDEYVGALGSNMSEGLEAGRLLMVVEPGYLLNIGQQLNVVVRVPGLGVEDVLFRAYIPPTGFPVNLDLYDAEPVACADEDALGEAILQFVAQPAVRNRLATLREMAQN